MSRLLCMIVLSGLCIACNRPLKAIQSVKKKEPQITLNEDIEPKRITLYTSNLSEDMNMLATQNDEIVVLLYYHPHGNMDTVQLVSSEYHVFTNIDTLHTYSWTPAEEEDDDYYTLVMIEEDNETPIPILDSAIRSNWLRLKTDFQADNYSGIRQYLGDEDILGVTSFTWTTLPTFENRRSARFSIKGVHKMDKYRYDVIITR
ncbi:MAG: hypothetical protein JJ975_15090 [Bacteroidia bacterium]|nr:hypothetical protein [Bacteroidia bacterium]